MFGSWASVAVRTDLFLVPLLFKFSPSKSHPKFSCVYQGPSSLVDSELSESAVTKAKGASRFQIHFGGLPSPLDSLSSNLMFL